MWEKMCTYPNYNLAASAATAVLKKKKKVHLNIVEGSHIVTSTALGRSCTPIWENFLIVFTDGGQAR